MPGSARGEAGGVGDRRVASPPRSRWDPDVKSIGSPVRGTPSDSDRRKRALPFGYTEFGQRQKGGPADELHRSAPPSESDIRIVEVEEKQWPPNS